ncbi:nucleotide-binding domain-containing protein [Pseudomonas oryzihabitans]|uniref:nucleotide-binding domain-containing protein n=1 Tax=Pseudomonas oryzihabitans TaxID=47885 RepID=UPI001ABF9D7D|nr:adenylate/guanylate cyclase domain-containing protein [Pseudomonas oryzihabitans]
MKKGIGQEAFRHLLRDAKRRSGVSEGLKKSFESQAMDSVTASRSLGDLDQEYSIQKQVRPNFMKPGVNHGAIGSHPDFAHLADTRDTERHHVCSLFLDIKNSTRLSFLYDLDLVFAIKNFILKGASEAVRAMDGHVHRFMGDALLAFFGSKSISEDDSVVNAINCCAVLQALMENTIIPVLVDEGVEARDIGFRIGLDFGGDDQVLWGAYGFSSVYEVTATSFYVDVAAKLQAMALKNKAMMGESIVSKIDFPSDFLRKKVIKKDGAIVFIDTLNKSYTDRQGNVTKYRVRELHSEAYRDLLPYPAELKADFEGSSVVSSSGFEFKCYVQGDGGWEFYPSVSRMLPKYVSLQFRLKLSSEVYRSATFPLIVEFFKRNHGREAQLEKGAGRFPSGSETVVLDGSGVRGFFNGKTIAISEGTKYRGLHTMEVVVRDNTRRVIYRDFIGVFIE